MKYYLTYLAKDSKYKKPNAWDSVRSATEDLKDIFPFIGTTNFEDWIQDAGMSLKSYPQTYDVVHRRKMNFLFAGWTKKKTDDWVPDFYLDNIDQAMQYDLAYKPH